jgi:hypothetical protein
LKLLKKKIVAANPQARIMTDIFDILLLAPGH